MRSVLDLLQRLLLLVQPADSVVPSALHAVCARLHTTVGVFLLLVLLDVRVIATAASLLGHRSGVGEFSIRQAVWNSSTVFGRLRRSWYAANMHPIFVTRRWQTTAFIHIVVIGSSPLLAYCTVFIVMFSDVVDLHISVCIRNPVTACTCVCIGCVPHLHCLKLLRRRLHADPPTQFPAVLTCFHPFAVVWREVTWPSMCSIWGRDFSTLFKSDVVE